MVFHCTNKLSGEVSFTRNVYKKFADFYIQEKAKGLSLRL